MDRARRSALRSAVAALAACAVPLSAQVVTPLASGAPLNTTLLGGGLTYFSFTRNVSLPVPADATFSVDVVPLAALAPAAGAPIAVWVTSDVDAGGLPVKPTCGAAAPCNGVDNVPQPSEWSSLRFIGPLGPFVEVTQGSPGFAVNATFTIAVWSPLTVPVVVSAVLAADVLTLLPGVGGDLVLPGTGGYRFAEVNFVDVSPDGSTRPPSDVGVMATALSGAVDLFASGDFANRRPMSGAAPWSAGPGSAGAAGRGTLFVPRDNITCSFIGLSLLLNCGVYIGVRVSPGSGGAAAAVTLVAEVVNAGSFNPITLTPGRPDNGAVPTTSFGGGALYYTVTTAAPPGANPAWTLVVSPTAGSPTVAVLRGAGAVPSATNADWSSATDGVQVIKAGGDAGGVPPCGSCTMNIGVFCAPGTPSCAFTTWFVLGGEAAVVTLEPFVTFADVAPRGAFGRTLLVPPLGPGVDLRLDVSYAAFPTMAFALSPYRSGQPRPRPTPGDACRVYRAFTGSLAVVASSAGADRCACPPEDAGCGYVISAYCGAAGDRACERYAITPVPAVAVDMRRLTDGQPAAAVIGPGAYAYFAFSCAPPGGSGAPVPVGVNVALSPSFGAPALYATNTFVIGSSPASALPSNATAPGPGAWAARAGPPYGGGASLVITAADLATCVAPSCTDLVVAVFGGAEGAAFTVTARLAAGGRPLRLAPQVPSPALDIPANTSATFEFELTAESAARNGSAGGGGGRATQSDLDVTATVLAGRVYMSMSPGAPPAPCVPTGGGVACSGRWVTNASVLHVAAAAPCRGPAVNPAAGACNASDAWRPRSTYFLSVYAAGPDPARVSLAVERLGAVGHVTALLPGLPLHSHALHVANASPPQADAAAAGPRRLQPPRPSPRPTRPPGPPLPTPPPRPSRNPAPPRPPGVAVAPPALYAFSTSGLSAAPVRFTVSARSSLQWRLDVWLTSCRASACARTSLDPNGTAVDFFRVPPRDTRSFVSHPPPGGGAAWCGPAADGTGAAADPCTFIVRVSPVCVAPGGDCGGPGRANVSSVAIDVAAAVQGGTDPVILPPSALRGGGVPLVGALPPGAGGTRYIVYTGAVTGGPPVPLTLRLSSGGPLTASAYLCDPSLAPASPGACTDPFAPGPGAGRSTVAVVTGGAAAGGAGVLRYNATSALVVVGVAADGAGGAVGGAVGDAVGNVAPVLSAYAATVSAGAPPAVLSSGAAVGATGGALAVTAAPRNDGWAGVTVSWAPAFVVGAPAGAPPPLPRYAVYYALGGFDAGFNFSYLPATPVGLGAWADATGFAPYVTAPGATSATLPAPLAPTAPYAVNVVAVCDAPCMLAAGGYASGQSAAYNVTYFTTAASGGGGGGGAPLAVAVGAPVGSVVVLALIAAGVCLVVRRRRNGSSSGSGGVGAGAGASVGASAAGGTPTGSSSRGALLIVPNPVAAAAGAARLGQLDAVRSGASPPAAAAPTPALRVALAPVPVPGGGFGGGGGGGGATGATAQTPEWGAKTLPPQ